MAHTAAALAERGHRVSLDGFDELIAHLATVHPSKYIKLIDGIEFIAIEGVHELTDQNAALRLVAFIDRVYDAEVPIIASGTPARRGVRRRDDARRLPQEVPARDAPHDRPHHGRAPAARLTPRGIRRMARSTRIRDRPDSQRLRGPRNVLFTSMAESVTNAETQHGPSRNVPS